MLTFHCLLNFICNHLQGIRIQIKVYVDLVRIQGYKCNPIVHGSVDVDFGDVVGPFFKGVPVGGASLSHSHDNSQINVCRGTIHCELIEY